MLRLLRYVVEIIGGIGATATAFQRTVIPYALDKINPAARIFIIAHDHAFLNELRNAPRCDADSTRKIRL